MVRQPHAPFLAFFESLDAQPNIPRKARTHERMEMADDWYCLDTLRMFDHGRNADKSCTCFEGAHRAPHPAAPVPAVGTPVLPAGCALGIPVMAGTEAVPLPQGKALFQVVMAFVEQDDYYSIIEFVRRCGDEVDLKRKCGFSVALTPEDGRADNVPRQLTVRGASLLSYAICIGSFRAATALILACPSFLSLSCNVFASMEDGAPRTEHIWTSSDLVRIFCKLYSEEESCDEEVIATAALYNLALPVIEVGEQDVSKLPYLALPTAAQRITAAGNDAEAVIRALSIAAIDHYDAF